jgi:hypothetical protein
VTNRLDLSPIPGVLSLMSRMIFNTIPGVLEWCDCCDLQNGALLLGYPARLSGKVGLASHGAWSPPKNLNFHAGFLATGEIPPGWPSLRWGSNSILPKHKLNLYPLYYTPPWHSLYDVDRHLDMEPSPHWNLYIWWTRTWEVGWNPGSWPGMNHDCVTSRRREVSWLKNDWAEKIWA